MRTASSFARVPPAGRVLSTGYTPRGRRGSRRRAAWRLSCARDQRWDTTTTWVVRTTLFALAAIKAVPVARAVTKPVLVTEAIASLEDDHTKTLMGITS